MSEQEQQRRPGGLILVRDIAVFILGLAILLRQAGIPPFQPPDQISVPLLVIGALCCNVPGILQAVAWKFGGIAGPGSPSAGLPPAPPAAPSLSTSSEGE